MKAGPDKTTFIGSEGWVAPSRNNISAKPESLLKVKIKADENHLLQDTNHYLNFLKCVKSRSTPASDIDSATHSDFISHLCDIAIRTGHKIKWDSNRETIIGDEEATRMLRRSMRSPWRL